MKKLFLIGCMVIAAMTASAQNDIWNDEPISNDMLQHKYDFLDTYGYINADSIMREVERSGMLHRLTPTSVKGAYLATDWKSNWFAGVSGGVSAFIGNPKGCGDLFDRISPDFSVYVGKWHTPMIGTRVAFKAGKFKDMMLEKHSYQAYHADFLYNVTNHWLADGETQRRWDVIPYLGLGFVNGSTLYHADCPCDACNGNNRAFMLAYGVQGRYRLNDRLHLTGEIGGFSTFNDFDNHGSCHSFGDKMLSLNVGLSVNIGNVGFKRPIDSKPYIAQNDFLINNFGALCDANKSLHNQHLVDENTLRELRKILEIEGLLDKYGYVFKDKARNKRNYYPGILALRSRLNAEKNAAKEKDMLQSSMNKMFEGRDSILNQPVYFFFKRGTTKLTDESQLVNLDEIARVANYHDITLRIDGAADSSTGSSKGNAALSKKRASYICKQLMKRGVPSARMKIFAHGGVNEHDRPEEDRNSKVSVYIEL